jgi:Family of unknown function (DUF5996)
MSNITETSWPELPTEDWRDTYATLHLWTQIVGKIRLARTPWLNHSWHVTLYVSARGLTTSPIPDGERTFQIDFDFVDHALRLAVSDGSARQFPLVAESVASFHARVMRALNELGIAVAIDEMPNELPDPVRFSEDVKHASYDPDAVQRLFKILLNSDRVFKQFRTGFLGKASPVHFFWGSFDLAVTRFSGRRAPQHPGGVPHLPDAVAQEAYSHEVSSAGFWPGGGAVDYPRVLFLRLPRACRLPHHEGASRCSLLQRGARRVHPAVRPGAHGTESRQGLARFPAEHLRGRGDFSEMGSLCAGKRPRPARCSAAVRFRRC